MTWYCWLLERLYIWHLNGWHYQTVWGLGNVRKTRSALTSCNYNFDKQRYSITTRLLKNITYRGVLEEQFIVALHIGYAWLYGWIFPRVPDDLIGTTRHKREPNAHLPNGSQDREHNYKNYIFLKKVPAILTALGRCYPSHSKVFRAWIEGRSWRSEASVMKLYLNL